MQLCIKEDGMGRECGTHGGEQMYVGFWLENPKERGFFEEQVLYMRIILKWMGGRGLN
jgi:hypothetical protein